MVSGWQGGQDRGGGDRKGRWVLLAYGLRLADILSILRRGSWPNLEFMTSAVPRNGEQRSSVARKFAK